MTKSCTKCGVEKPLDDYYGNGRHSRCKPCHNEDSAERKRADPEKYREYHRNWRKKHPGASRKWRLSLYGLTQDSFDALLAAQGGACAVCHTDEPGGKGNWHIDHDHSCCPDSERSCGKCVRGLLCWRCNVGLSHFKDNPEVLMRAAGYVRGDL